MSYGKAAAAMLLALTLAAPTAEATVRRRLLPEFNLYDQVLRSDAIVAGLEVQPGQVEAREAVFGPLKAGEELDLAELAALPHQYDLPRDAKDAQPSPQPVSGHVFLFLRSHSERGWVLADKGGSVVRVEGERMYEHAQKTGSNSFYVYYLAPLSPQKLTMSNWWSTRREPAAPDRGAVSAGEFRAALKQALEKRVEFERAKVTPEPSRRVEALLPYFIEGSSTWRWSAQDAIEQAGPVAGPYLRDVLTEHGDLSLRCDTIRAMGGCGDRESVPVLVKLLGKHAPFWRQYWGQEKRDVAWERPHQAYRETHVSVEALRRLKDSRAIPALRQIRDTCKQAELWALRDRLGCSPEDLAALCDRALRELGAPE